MLQGLGRPSDATSEVLVLYMALKKSQIYSTLTKCANELRSKSGISAESFKNYVLILLFLKYLSDKKKSGDKDTSIIEIPEGCSFDDIIALKGKKNIGEEINKIISRISEENELEGYIDPTKHDFCDKDLGDTENASKLITKLVAAFQDSGLDFSKNRAADDDLIGDAYEYLMRNFASLSGKDKGQFYTPTEVSRLMALLIGIDQDTRPQVSAYDPTCGSGSLLLRVRAAAKCRVSIDGQDIDRANIELSYLNAVIHGCETPRIKWGDTLNNPQHTRDSNTLEQFDYVVSNPKFSLHNWMGTAKENDVYGRWNQEIGVPPQQFGDFAFLLHCVRSLKPEGVCAIILPNGVLTRGGEEQKLRRWLVDEQHILSGVIAFPANAFFGTSIAGNVLILDKRRKHKGVFFIDGSSLGCKDADSKIRLGEQDIKRVIDVWRAQEDVPYFSRLVTYDTDESGKYEIERNDFSLNMSLYVTPIDTEIHHDIEAHLHGGMPIADVERMADYWNICPSLRDVIFAPLHDGYVKLAVEKLAIAQTIRQEPSVVAQKSHFYSCFEQWKEEMLESMAAVAKDCDPKTLIASWGQSLLDTFNVGGMLTNPYDVYDQLLIYYNESLQDDLYMISNGGWMPELVAPKKKSLKWTDLYCDLLPVEIVVDAKLHDLKMNIDDAETRLADVQQQITTLLEENEDDLDPSLFNGKRNIANLKKTLDCCRAKKLTEADVAYIEELLSWFDKSNNEYKLKRAELIATRPDLFADVESPTKAEIKKLISVSEQWVYSTEEQRTLWQQFLKALETEKAIKDEIKVVGTEMLQGIIEAYKSLTEQDARQLIIENKWLATIEQRIISEMSNAIHRLIGDVTSLVERYEHTLSDLTAAYDRKAATVLNHLKTMGYEL